MIIEKNAVTLGSYEDGSYEIICVTKDYDTALNAAMGLNEIMFRGTFDEILSELQAGEEVYAPFVTQGGFGVGVVYMCDSFDPVEIIEEYREYADCENTAYDFEN